MRLLKVAAGIIKNANGDILITYRAKHLPQGNLWEFPGGKFATGENAKQALVRELHEEIAIAVEHATPTIQIGHQYPDKMLQLHVWTVHLFSGTVRSVTGQAIKWVSPNSLGKYKFPTPNQPIITAAILPSYYAILGGSSPATIKQNLRKMLANGVRIIQLRTKDLVSIQLQTMYKSLYLLCQQAGAILLVNSAIYNLLEFSCDGVHLTSKHLLDLKQRPTIEGWVAASCHSQQELLHAQAIGVDFVVLAPIKIPRSYSGFTAPLGWNAFADLVAEINIPVYALGGMQKDDLLQANQAGAQGIAGISAFL